MNTKVNLLWFIFFNLILKFALGLSDTDCQNKSPNENTDCTNTDIGVNKKCCFFSHGSSPQKKCSAITITSFESMVAGIEEYKTSLTDKTNFVSDCNTQMEVCSKIINPQRDLACTGRKVEEPYSCCFIKADKTDKSCIPIDAKELQTIIDYAKSYKEKNGLEKEPEVVCNSNIEKVNLILYMIIYLAVIYI